jgi:hypothetical protein
MVGETLYWSICLRVDNSYRPTADLTPSDTP